MAERERLKLLRELAVVNQESRKWRDLYEELLSGTDALAEMDAQLLSAEMDELVADAAAKADIDQEQLGYFRRVEECLFEGSMEAHSIHNVFLEMQGEEQKFSGHKDVSGIIVQLLPRADPLVRSQFMVALGDALPVTVLDAFASQVLRKLMDLSAEVAPVAAGEEQMARIWLLRVAKFVVGKSLWDLRILLSC